jgi:hypothetical protein
VVCGPASAPDGTGYLTMEKATEGLPGCTSGQGLADIARHVINTSFGPHVLIYTASHDVERISAARK